MERKACLDELTGNSRPGCGEEDRCKPCQIAKSFNFWLQDLCSPSRCFYCAAGGRSFKEPMPPLELLPTYANFKVGDLQH